MALLPVDQALARMLHGVIPTESETVPLTEASGRVLAEDVTALRTQPPFPASAMDGYAVRAADLDAGGTLRVVGESVAGRRYSGTLSPGEAVRIFTGAPVPDGADTILIQENATRDGDRLTASGPEPQGRFVRAAGLDFTQGETLLRAGTRLAPRHVALAAAANHASLPLRRRPRVALLSTGDELVQPGETPGPDQIVSSNAVGLAAMLRGFGAESVDLGIARDTLAALDEAIGRAVGMRADMLVTLGGASVGDHDLVGKALQNRGLELAFWKIAMRPGKPLMFGALGAMRCIGLPGNPVSALVCTLLFLRPLVAAFLGLPPPQAEIDAVLGRDLPVNDERQDYMRARLERRADGILVASPFAKQDSSMLSLLAQAEGLVVRAPHAAAAKAGTPCKVIPLDV